MVWWIPLAAAGLQKHANQNAADKNAKEQRTYAQNSIQWKVKDAQAAGIHPLYALGSQPINYTPVNQPADYQMAGQDISRAIMANRDANDRQAAVKTELVRQETADLMAVQNHKMGLERGALENELLRSQIARANSAQLGPPAPSAAPGAVERYPAQVEVGSVGAPERAPDAISEYQFFRSSDGGIGFVPSAQMKERIEDSPMQWSWFLRNNIMPPAALRSQLHREYPLPPGYYYDWDPIRGTFQPRRSN